MSGCGTCYSCKMKNASLCIKAKKLASYLHRTATTARPCYIPVLGDSAGAGRIRLASGCKSRLFFHFSKSVFKKVRETGMIPVSRTVYLHRLFYASIVFFTSSSMSSVSSRLLPSAYTRSRGSVPLARSIIQPPLSKWYFTPSVSSVRLKPYLPNLV